MRAKISERPRALPKRKFIARPTIEINVVQQLTENTQSSEDSNWPLRIQNLFVGIVCCLYLVPFGGAITHNGALCQTIDLTKLQSSLCFQAKNKALIETEVEIELNLPTYLSGCCCCSIVYILQKRSFSLVLIWCFVLSVG